MTAKKTREKIKYVTKQEMDNLFDAIKKTGHDAITPGRKLNYYRDRAMFHIIYYLGLRASEVGLLTLDDYDPKKKSIYVRALKKGESRTLKLDNKRALVLDKYLKIRRGDTEDIINIRAPLFPSQNKKSTSIDRRTITYLMEKYAKKARWPKEKRHPHTLRHSIAVHLLESQLDIREVQIHLRHKDIRSTLVYSAYTLTQDEIILKKIEMSPYIAH